jgi:hypothetical protein
LSLQNVNVPKTSFLRDFQFLGTTKQILQDWMGDVKIPLEWEIYFDVRPRVGVTEFRLEIQVPNLPIGSSKGISDLEIARSLLGYGAQCDALIRDLLCQMRPHMFEFDPRIGHNPCDRGILPRCPYFDPDEPFVSNPGLGGTGSKCSLCGDFLGFDRYFWGGGNLLWVHKRCWELG